MKIETPLHAEHQLDQLAGQCAHWRQTRPPPHRPIPPERWAHAVALTAGVPPSRVAKQLRLRLTDLKKHMAPPPPYPWALWKCRRHPPGLNLPPQYRSISLAPMAPDCASTVPPRHCR